MARVLIVGGGCRGVRLAGELHADGHAVRIATRTDSRRSEIETVGAECFIGTPQRLATLRSALEHVTVACWLLATASGEPDEVQALHSSRVERFVESAIDTTVRGIVYEAGGGVLPSAMLSHGAHVVSATAALNAIPVAILTADPRDIDAWMDDARGALRSLLSPWRGGRAAARPERVDRR